MTASVEPTDAEATLKDPEIRERIEAAVDEIRRLPASMPAVADVTPMGTALLAILGLPLKPEPALFGKSPEDSHLAGWVDGWNGALAATLCIIEAAFDV